MEIKNILVTGSSGYIGSVLCQKLIDAGYFVTGTDSNFYVDAAFSKQNKYPFRQMDIRDIKIQDLHGFDAIIHLAALSNDPLGEIKKELTQEINHKATVNLAKMAKKAWIKRFIFASSCSIYGISKTGTVNEESKVKPLTAYAKSKINSEKRLVKLASSNFTVVNLRNSTVYGFSPAFRNDLVVNNFITCALALGEIQIKSDGTPWRPLIDVRDLSDIFIKFLELPAVKINGKTINIGFEENNLQIKEVLEKVKKSLPKCQIVYTNEHGPDTRSYIVDFTKFEKLLPDFKQKWTIDKSIKDLIVNLKKIKFSKNDFETGKYSRLNALNSLLAKKELDEDLYWNN